MNTALSMESGMAMDYERVGHLFTARRPIISLAKLAKHFGQTESINR